MIKPAASEVVAGINLALVREKVAAYSATESNLAEAEKQKAALEKSISDGMKNVSPLDVGASEKLIEKLAAQRIRVELLGNFILKCQADLERLETEIQPLCNDIQEHLFELSATEMKAFLERCEPSIRPYVRTPELALFLAKQTDVYHEIAQTPNHWNTGGEPFKCATIGLAIVDRYFKTGTLCRTPWRK